jgi:chaperone modulatory protein CbpM
MARKILIYTGTLIDETTRYSLKELCDICGVHAEWVIELVEYGILNPVGKTSRSWEFSSSELNALKRALRLQRDLEINLPGIAMALDLLEELEVLRRRLDRLEQQYDKWFD